MRNMNEPLKLSTCAWFLRRKYCYLQNFHSSQIAVEFYELQWVFCMKIRQKYSKFVGKIYNQEKIIIL